MGRAGPLVIGRSLVQIPAPGRAELHFEVSLSEILNAETRLGLAPTATPCDPMERDKRLRTMT